MMKWVPFLFKMQENDLYSLVSSRCLVCRMQMRLCLCDQMPHLNLRTHLTLLMQRKELGIGANTGHFIPKVFQNAEIRFRGTYDKRPLDVSDLFEGGNPVLVLFPHKDAKILDADFVASLKQPARLIVLDGNWRQTGKMFSRVSGLSRAQKVVLPLSEPSSYRLRNSPRPDGVCTFEAVARAMGALEGIEVQKKLEYFFDMMVERVLWTRGKLKAHEVTGGIPKSAGLVSE